MYKKYQLVEKAIHFFVENQYSQPSLTQLASHVGVSESFLQRVFSEWVGLSPKQFLQYLTNERAKSYLNEMSVNAASLESGLSGSGRLHDLLLLCEGMTPGEFKRYGEGLMIHYGAGMSPFGLCFMAQTDRGVCKIAFYDGEQQFSNYEDELRREWPRATLIEDQAKVAHTLSIIFPAQRSLSDQPQPLRLLLKGTPFQIKVWEALLNIDEGQLCSYQMLAEQIKAPSSVRAVASAIAKNNIGYLIPCHRVIKSSGAFNQYRWGADRKMAMIGWEQAKVKG